MHVSNKSKPIVFIPGFLGSWNKEAILHNKPVSLFDWQLNPIVREYDGLLNTLKNIDYAENRDFYVFNYDWRKKLDDLADDFNTYLNEKTITNHKIYIVGHSLGGLVGRIYLQKYGHRYVQKLLTIGTPHNGVAAAYKAFAGGEIERESSVFWLIGKFLLFINKEKGKSNKDIIREKFPIVKDMLPTYGFLKDKNGNAISIEKMKVKNKTLLKYNADINIIKPYCKNLVGKKAKTHFGYVVDNNHKLSKDEDIYPDGRPIAKTNQIGDSVVPLTSCAITPDSEVLNLNHDEMIGRGDMIKKILAICNI